MTTTGVCLVLVGIAAAVLVTAALTGLCRAVRLERLLEDHDRAESELDDLDLPRGGGECGCFWHYLPGGHFRLYTCEAHAFICTPDGEA
jgi:hypothetical protein